MQRHINSINMNCRNSQQGRRISMEVRHDVRSYGFSASRVYCPTTGTTTTPTMRAMPSLGRSAAAAVPAMAGPHMSRGDHPVVVKHDVDHKRWLHASARGLSRGCAHAS